MPEHNRHNEEVKVKRVDLALTRLGLGTAPLGGLFTSVQDTDSDELIATAFDQGIRYFDTAPLYGHGRSEIRLGRALRLAKQPYILSTKVGRVLNSATNVDVTWFADADPNLEPVYDYSRDGIKRSIEDSLTRLGVDHIDIALMHDAENHVSEAINNAYPVLADLRSQGVIKAVGIGMIVCSASVAIMKETDLDVALIAGRFTLLDQEAQDGLFPLALKKNVSIIIGGVFNSGVLANPNPGAMYEYVPAPVEIIERARKIGAFLKERNVPLTAAALQFPLRHPAVATVLTGSRNKTELLSNIKDFDREIPADIWTDLEKSGLIHPLKV